MRFSESNFYLQIKRLWKPFLLIFLIFFLIFNWGEISWIFNYKAVSIFFSNFFHQNEKLEESLPQSTFVTSLTEPTIEERFEYTEKSDSLEIPRIEIFAPIFLADSKDEKKVLENLDRGVVLFSDYSLPGQRGQTVILGHSARHDWPKSNSAWVFTYLRDVKEGDEIILHFNHRKYSYSVTRKFVLKEGEELPASQTEENVLMLITCWPPGRLVFKQRLIVEAKIK